MKKTNNKSKTKCKPNPDLYTNEEGILVGVGHVVIGKLDKRKQVGKPAKGEVVIPRCKGCDNL